jgi:hypothetical protein
MMPNLHFSSDSQDKASTSVALDRRQGEQMIAHDLDRGAGGSISNSTSSSIQIVDGNHMHRMLAPGDAYDRGSSGTLALVFEEGKAYALADGTRYVGDGRNGINISDGSLLRIDDTKSGALFVSGSSARSSSFSSNVVGDSSNRLNDSMGGGA